MRTVFADRTATDEELLNKASLPSLANRRLQEILILMYKVNHSLAPEHISNIFYKQDKHNLRSDLPIPRYGTVKYGKHSIRYVGPYFGGKISQDVTYAVRLALERLWELYTILMSQSLLDGVCNCCACTWSYYRTSPLLSYVYIYFQIAHSFSLFSLFFFLLRFCLVSPITVVFLAKDLDDLNKVYQSSFLCQRKTQSSSDEAEWSLKEALAFPFLRSQLSLPEAQTFP